MRIEIDLIATGADVQVEVIHSDRIPQPLVNYSAGYRAGDYIFLAGQLGTDFEHGIAPEARIDPNFPFYGSAIGRQTEYTLTNLQRLLEDAGSDLDHVVKAQVFLTRAEDFLEFDHAWHRAFGDSVPPRTTVEIMDGGLLVADALVEIDLTAVAR